MRLGQLRLQSPEPSLKDRKHISGGLLPAMRLGQLRLQSPELSPKDRKHAPGALLPVPRLERRGLELPLHPADCVDHAHAQLVLVENVRPEQPLKRRSYLPQTGTMGLGAREVAPRAEGELARREGKRLRCRVVCFVG